jgi:hypothetical protein
LIALHGGGSRGWNSAVIDAPTIRVRGRRSMDLKRISG